MQLWKNSYKDLSFFNLNLVELFTLEHLINTTFFVFNYVDPMNQNNLQKFNFCDYL